MATLGDYEAVRELTTEAYAAAQDDGLTPAQRAAVAAVRALCEERGRPAAEATGISLTDVAARLRLDKSAASRRLANPLGKGYLQNLNAAQKGRSAAYVPGEPLPEATSALPDRGSVEVWLDEHALREIVV